MWIPAIAVTAAPRVDGAFLDAVNASVRVRWMGSADHPMDAAAFVMEPALQESSVAMVCVNASPFVLRRLRAECRMDAEASAMADVPSGSSVMKEHVDVIRFVRQRTRAAPSMRGAACDVMWECVRRDKNVAMGNANARRAVMVPCAARPMDAAVIAMKDDAASASFAIRAFAFRRIAILDVDAVRRVFAGRVVRSAARGKHCADVRGVVMLERCATHALVRAVSMVRSER